MPYKRSPPESGFMSEAHLKSDFWKNHANFGWIHNFNFAANWLERFKICYIFYSPWTEQAGGHMSGSSRHSQVIHLHRSTYRASSCPGRLEPSWKPMSVYGYSVQSLRRRWRRAGSNGGVPKPSCCEFKERSPTAVALWGGLEAGGGRLGPHGNLICLKNVLISTFIREVLDFFFPRRIYFFLTNGWNKWIWHICSWLTAPSW